MAAVVGYKSDVHAEILQQRTLRRRSASLAATPEPVVLDEDADLDVSSPPGQGAEERELEADEENPWDHLPEGFIGLRVRSKDHPVGLELQVKQKMLVRAVLRHFLREHGQLDRMASARLEFDGEFLDPKTTIEDSGAETDDVMSVVFS
jgi:hypothetical protein